MVTVNYQLAKKYNTKYILAGTNLSTEGMKMPKNMNWLKFDKKISYLLQKYLEKKNKNFSNYRNQRSDLFSFYKKIKWISF